MNLIAQGHRVAVLAVDPTSTRTGGSILGDKTRMARLAQEPRCLHPPLADVGHARRRRAQDARDACCWCEAAGFDVVIVETVGVGQSEVAVADMVDFFLVLLLAGGGDELQGIKKGIIEIADMIAINKADGDNVARAQRAAAEYRAALHILTPPRRLDPAGHHRLGRDNRGLDAMWQRSSIIADKSASGEFEARRQRQAVTWMRDMLSDRVMASVHANPKVAERVPRLEAEVGAGRLLPTLAVDEIVSVSGLS